MGECLGILSYISLLVELRTLELLLKVGKSYMIKRKLRMQINSMLRQNFSTVSFI